MLLPSLQGSTSLNLAKPQPSMFRSVTDGGQQWPGAPCQNAVGLHLLLPGFRSPSFSKLGGGGGSGPDLLDLGLTCSNGDSAPPHLLSPYPRTVPFHKRGHTFANFHLGCGVSVHKPSWVWRTQWFSCWSRGCSRIDHSSLSCRLERSGGILPALRPLPTPSRCCCFRSDCPFPPPHLSCFSPMMNKFFPANFPNEQFQLLFTRGAGERREGKSVCWLGLAAWGISPQLARLLCFLTQGRWSSLLAAFCLGQWDWLPFLLLMGPKYRQVQFCVQFCSFAGCYFNTLVPA